MSDHPELSAFAHKAMADLDAIQATVERIVKQRDEARAERDTLLTDLTRVGEWYSVAMKEIGRLTAERDAAAAKERAAVVAWVRDIAGTASHNGDRCAGRIEEVADSIEAGDHLEDTRA